MRSRIVQEVRSTSEPEEDPAAPVHRYKARGPAARIGRWSARNRKKAIFGWLAFVVVVFMAGGAIGTQNISNVDTYSGESHDAEVAADAAGLRPNQEIVFIHSDKL